MFQDDVSEKIPLAHRPHRARPAKLPIPSPQPPSKVIQQVDPAVVKADVGALAEADTAAPVDENTTVPAEVNAATPAGVDATDGVGPPVKAEVTAETPMHPQDFDLDIPPQEVTSAYVRIPTFILTMLFPLRVLNRGYTKCKVPPDSFHKKFYSPRGIVYISWPPQWPSNVDNLHRPRELRSSLKH